MESVEAKPFVIEKGVPKPGSRGPHSAKHPDFFRIKETTDRMDRGDSFVYPLNGQKIWTVKNWLKKISKAATDKIMDEKIRHRSPICFSCVAIKDAIGTITGARIFRDN